MIKDIWHYSKPYKSKLAVAVFLRASSDIANLAPAFIYSMVIETLSSDKPDKLDTIFPLILIWIIASYYYRVAHDLAKFIGHTLSKHIGLEAKLAGLNHMYHLDLTWHELENSGNKIKKIDNAKIAIQNTIKSVFDILIENLVNIVGVGIIFFKIDKTIAIIFLIYMIVFFLLSRKMSQRVSNAYKPISKEEENYEGISFESIHNIHTLKSLLLYDYVGENLNKSLTRLKKFITKFILISRIRNHILDMLTRIVDFSIMIYLIIRIANNIEDLAILILYRGLFWKLIEAIWEFTELYNEWLINKVYMQRFHELMIQKPIIEIQDGQADFPKDWQEINIKDLTFSYTNKKVLNNLNLIIKKGEKVGIVGISGAGKSTFIKLLLDLYEDYTGEINFNNSSLKEIRREDYINYVSYVSQDTELFNSSLEDNIVMGFPKATQASIKEACKIAQLDNVISKLPEGLDTIIGEKGFKLSGGERQRVGIARAIIRDPQLLILDEATSHLDSESEEKIQKALNTIFQRTTAVVVAHRLSTLRKMDKIIVLDQGEVKETGTMEELIGKNGLFFKFWNKQQGQSF